MNQTLGHDFVTLALHKARHDELVAEADHERMIHKLRDIVDTRLRRAVRVNNDSKR